MVKQRRSLFWNQRRIGEAVTIASGIGVTVLGIIFGADFVSYSGLCIAGLGVVSIVWK